MRHVALIPLARFTQDAKTEADARGLNLKELGQTCWENLDVILVGIDGHAYDAEFWTYLQGGQMMRPPQN